MCATLVGGMDRLRREYINAAKATGVDLKVFTGKENCIASQMGLPDLVIVFTSKVSHAARKEVVQYAKSHNIPLKMVHACGVSSLRQNLA